MSSQQDSFVTTNHAANILGVAPKTIQVWVEKGIIKAWKTGGGHRRISQNSLNAILHQREEDLQGKKREQSLELLVVEDDSVLATVYQSMVKSWPFPVDLTAVETGFDALLHIGRKAPDMIITDLAMPNMDGFAMIKALREKPELDGIPIIVVTALSAEKISNLGGIPEGIPVFRKPPPADQLQDLAQERAESIGILNKRVAQR
jgi:excisionase family DNA binding protein